MKQQSFSDIELGQSRKVSRISVKLDKIDKLVNWEAVYELVKVVDKTSKTRGGAPHRDLLVKTKIKVFAALI